MCEAGVSGRQSRRREILFAVCAAESYIFEWVRDTVLHHDFSILNQYFPADAKRGVTNKLRDIPQKRYRDGRVHAPLDCGGREFAEFKKLVAFRDGLVHASASRPETSNQTQVEKPVPSRSELDALAAGWAAEVVRAILDKLHKDTHTSPPVWL